MNRFRWYIEQHLDQWAGIALVLIAILVLVSTGCAFVFSVVKLFAECC